MNLQKILKVNKNMKIISNYGMLMHLAKKLGNARKSGNVDDIILAKNEHDEYVKFCLKSDEMIIPNMLRGDL